VSNTLKKTK